MEISGALLIFTSLLLGFFMIQGTALASRNLHSSPDLIRKDINRAGRAFLSWLFLVCVLGATNALADFKAQPPGFILFLSVMLVYTICLASSKVGKTLVEGLPIRYLVGFQSFRILSELALFAAYKEGLAPIQMTVMGMNHDLITGVSALLMAYLLTKKASRPMLTAWNILGLLLLIKVVVISVLSTPSSLRFFMNEPANTFIARMPYILLPGILVSFALLGHLLVFRWLWRKEGNLVSAPSLL